MQTTTPPAYEPVQIEIGGRTRSLFLSWAAIKRIKEKTGVDLRDPASLEKWDTDHLPVMLFEMLRHEPDAPSIEEVEEKLVHFGNAGYVAGKIFEAIGVDIFAVAELVQGMAEVQASGGDPLAFAKAQAGKKNRRKSRARRRIS
jgi:hypothetical protein